MSVMSLVPILLMLVNFVLIGVAVWAMVTAVQTVRSIAHSLHEIAMTLKRRE